MHSEANESKNLPSSGQQDEAGGFVGRPGASLGNPTPTATPTPLQIPEGCLPLGDHYTSAVNAIGWNMDDATISFLTFPCWDIPPAFSFPNGSSPKRTLPCVETASQSHAFAPSHNFSSNPTYVTSEDSQGLLSQPGAK